MPISIRWEKHEDYRRVEEITREAFWNVYRPGCYEHLVIHRLRQSPDFIPELDFVALSGDKLVGSIIYSHANIVKDNGRRQEVLTFGPLSVLPEWQGKGVGAALIEHSQKAAAGLGYKACIIYGDPEYYKAFGFAGAAKYYISPPDGKYIKALLVHELQEGVLGGSPGRFFASPSFMVKDEELEEFDKIFPAKKKEITESQKKFLALAAQEDRPS